MWGKSDSPIYCLYKILVSAIVSGRERGRPHDDDVKDAIPCRRNSPLVMYPHKGNHSHTDKSREWPALLLNVSRRRWSRSQRSGLSSPRRSPPVAMASKTFLTTSCCTSPAYATSWTWANPHLKSSATFSLVRVPPSRTTAFDTHICAGKITIEGRSLAVNEDFARQAIFLAQHLACSEKYIASILHAVMSDNPNTDSVNSIEATIVEFHQRRRHLIDCLRYLFEAAELARLPDPPRLYLRLEAFVRQELVPAARSAGPEAPLAFRIFREIESLGAAVTQAQISRQNARSNTIPPSGSCASIFF